MKFINCTPHPINVVNTLGVTVTYEPSGIIPRISTTIVDTEIINGIHFRHIEKGEVANLPNPEEGVLLIVSGMVFDTTERKDIIAPDTNGSAIRNDKGHIVAVTGFLTKGE